MAAKRERKRYPNLKYKFIRGLINEEGYERRKHWMKHAAEWTSRAITTLDLSSEEIKTVKQATELNGVGAKAALKLGRITRDKRFSVEPPQPGKFASSAPALLVALYLLHQEIEKPDMLRALILIPEDQLRKLASALCEEKFEDAKCESEGEGFCQAWWRLKLLSSRGYVKCRTRNKKAVYELLDDGIDEARKLIELAGLNGFTVGDVLSGRRPAETPYRDTDAAPSPAHQHLYTNHDGQDGVVVYVDLQEGGGQRQGLSVICKEMERTGIRYATRRLMTGDYSWVWYCGGQKVELPVLIERKRADDLAGSIKDGRCERQKEKMLKWTHKYADIGVEVQLMYVVEGDPATYVVKCADGCGGVGKCGNPNVQEVQICIDELTERPDFTLVRTPDTAATVDLIVAMTRELELRVKNGDFFGLLTLAGARDKVLDKNATQSPRTKSCTKGSGKNLQGNLVEDSSSNEEFPIMNLTNKEHKSKAVTRDASSSDSTPNKTMTFNITLDSSCDHKIHVTSQKKIDNILGINLPTRGEHFNHSDHLNQQGTSHVDSQERAINSNGIRGSAPRALKAESPTKHRRRVHLLDDEWLGKDDAPHDDLTRSFAMDRTRSPMKRQRWQSAPASAASHYPDVIVINDGSPISGGASNEVKPDPDFDFETLSAPSFEKDGSDVNGVKKELEQKFAFDIHPSVSRESSYQNEMLTGHVDIPASVKWCKELKQVKEVLADCDLGITVSLLELHDGNVERVIAALLDDMD